MHLFWTLTFVGFGSFLVPSVSSTSNDRIPFAVPEDLLEDIASEHNGHGMRNFGSRVKKGGAFDSISNSDSTPALTLLLPLDVTTSKEEEKRRAKAKSHNLVHLTSASNKKHHSLHSGKSHRSIPHHAPAPPPPLQHDENSRFYYFNEDLPATRVRHGYDPLIKLTSPNLNSGEPRSGNVHEAFPSKRSSKRNLPEESKSKSKSKSHDETLWDPILVDTKYGPFHLHVPIMNGKDVKNLKVDVQEILREATQYKNPLDFNFAAIPVLHGVHGEANSHPIIVRKRRGLGSWIKSVLHINKKKTTTPRPPPPKTSKPKTMTSSYDYDYENGGENTDQSNGEGHIHQESRDGERGLTKSVVYHPDQNGDTEIDWLLPKSLRKSSILDRLRLQSHAQTLIRMSRYTNGDFDTSNNNHVNSTESSATSSSPSSSSSRRKNRQQQQLSNSRRRRNKKERKSSNGNSQGNPANLNSRHEYDNYDDDNVDNGENENGNPTQKQSRRQSNDRVRSRSRSRSRKPLRSSQTPRRQNKYYDDSHNNNNSENSGRRKLKQKPAEGERNYESLEDGNQRFGESENYSMEDTFLMDKEIGKPPIRRVSRKKRSLLDFKTIIPVPVPVPGPGPEALSNTKTPVSTELNQLKNTLPSFPVTEISLNDPIERASKEELRLLHELFINIVNGKCPHNLEAQFVETYELNLFKIIDSSQWSSTQEETSSDISTLIHQLVNCSVNAETEKEALQMMLLQEKYSNYYNLPNEVEIGGPLYRSKRGRMKTNDNNNFEAMSDALLKIQMSNFEFSLISFVSEECRLTVSPTLLYSAAQLILEAIRDKFAPFIPFPERSIQSNLNVIQNCANLIIQHREEEIRYKRRLQESLKQLPRAVRKVYEFKPQQQQQQQQQLQPSSVEFQSQYNTLNLGELGDEDTLRNQPRTERRVQPALAEQESPNFSSGNKGLDSIFQEFTFPVFEDIDGWRYKK